MICVTADHIEIVRHLRAQAESLHDPVAKSGSGSVLSVREDDPWSRRGERADPVEQVGLSSVPAQSAEDMSLRSFSRAAPASRATDTRP